MAEKRPPSPLQIIFLAAMLLLIGIGVFMMVWGSLHNTVAAPVVPGGGLFARLRPHA